MNFGCWNSFKIGCHCDAATDCSHKQGKVEHENMTIPWNDWVYIKCKVRGATKKITAKIFHFVRSSEKIRDPPPNFTQISCFFQQKNSTDQKTSVFFTLISLKKTLFWGSQIKFCWPLLPLTLFFGGNIEFLSDFKVTFCSKS